MSEENRENLGLNNTASENSTNSVVLPDSVENTPKNLETQAIHEPKKKKKKKKGSYSIHKTKSVTISKKANENLEIESVAFPSAGLLLESARDEYTKERDRTQFLDNKASFFMSAIILVATIFVPVIPFSKFRKALLGGVLYEQIVLCVFGVLLLVSFGFLISAFRNLYNAYKIKAYERFNPENINKLDVLQAHKNSVEKALCDDYRDTIEKNIKNNDDKTISIQAGLKECSVGFLLLTISAIILMIVIG